MSSNLSRENTYQCRFHSLNSNLCSIRWLRSRLENSRSRFNKNVPGTRCCKCSFLLLCQCKCFCTATNSNTISHLELRKNRNSSHKLALEHRNFLSSQTRNSRGSPHSFNILDRTRSLNHSILTCTDWSRYMWFLLVQGIEC